MEERVNIKANDIVVDNGYGVYILTQDEKEITRKIFNQLLKHRIIYFDRHQWGVDHFLYLAKDKRWGAVKTAPFFYLYLFYFGSVY